MQDECKLCVYGEVCPGNVDDGECHGEWVFKAKTEIQKPEAVLSNHTDLLCATTCKAEKGGDLCSGDCAKEKIKNLFKYLDSFEYENDLVTIVRVKQALDKST